MILMLVCTLAAGGMSFGQVPQKSSSERAAEPGEKQDEPFLLMDLAEVYQRHKRFEKALELYGQALEKSARDYEKSRIHLAMARIERRHGKQETALRHMEQALELAPDEGPRSRIYPEFIGLLIRAGEWEKARVLAQQYADEAGSEAEKGRADHYLIQTYEAQGNLADLTGQLEQKLKEHPEDLALLSRLALAYDQMPGANRKAAEVYETLCRLRPEDASLFFRLARLYHKMGELDRSAAVYRKLIETASDPQQLEPDYVRLRVAKMYAEAGRKEKALEWTGTIGANGRAAPGVVSLKADLYSRLDMLEEALECYDNALREAESPDVRARLLFQSAELLGENQHYEAAEERLKAILEDPQMPERAREAAKTILSTLRDEVDKPTEGPSPVKD